MSRGKDASPLEAHLGFWLRHVSNAVSGAFARKLDAKGVSVGEWVVLRELLDSDDLPPSAISDRIGMTRGAITKIADRLIEKALLARRAESADRRYQSLTLTAKGRALVPVLAALADANDEEFFGHMSVAERARVARAMQDIVRRRALRTIPVN